MGSLEREPDAVALNRESQTHFRYVDIVLRKEYEWESGFEIRKELVKVEFGSLQSTAKKRKPFHTLKPRNPPSTLSNQETLQTMSSQNEVNEQGTMKHKPRGITARKNVVRSRSNNNKLTVEWNARGQPLNNKGGNKLVSYIGVVVRQNISIKFKHRSDERLNAAKDIIWKDITKISEQNHKRASNPIYPYSRMAIEELKKKLLLLLEQSETPSPLSAAIDVDVLSVDVWKN
ncbi:hypothetical protein Lal_00033847 [Lupinus albus]|nr:hypothetical protein Lal_00033847 [Lupinus albus]